MQPVFVSSTFRDMNFERDTLNKKISTELNYLLSQYNQSVRMTDLRWGIDTTELSEEEANTKILKVCFEEIDICKPYFIVLLGDRYGFIPEGMNESVTHMEIIHGLIENVDSENVFIYFRESDYSKMPKELLSVFVEQVPNSEKKLDNLKRQLKELYPERCRSYHSYWSQQENRMVSDDFEKIILDDLKSNFNKKLMSKRYDSFLERQLAENENILKEHIEFAYTNQILINEHINIIKNCEKHIALLGKSGSGKSVHMSLLYSRLKNDCTNTYIMFCGDNSFSTNTRNIAEFVLYILKMSSNEEYDYKKYSSYKYEDLISGILNQRKLVKNKSYLFLDSVDKCDSEIMSFMLWCNRFLRKELNIVCSSTDESTFAEKMNIFDILSLKHEPQSFFNMVQYMLKHYGKNSVNEHILNSISQKASTPLQLELLLLQLLELSENDFNKIQNKGGDIKAINTYLTNMLDVLPNDIVKLTETYTSNLIKEQSNKVFYTLLLGFLAYSEYGLYERDLQCLLELVDCNWVQLDFIKFCSRFSFFIRFSSDGRIDISHVVTRKCLKRIFAHLKKVFNVALADYIINKENLNSNDIKNFFTIINSAGLGSRFICFVDKYEKAFTSMDTKDIEIANEIKKNIADMFLNGDGMFVLSSADYCSSVDELFHFQGVLGSSLYSIDNHISEDVAINLIKAIMTIPTSFDAFPYEMALLELNICRNFALRHNISKEKTDSLILEYQKLLSKINGNGNKQEASYSAEQMLDMLKDDSMDNNRKLTILVKLIEIGTQLSNQRSEAERTISLFVPLLNILEKDETLLEGELKDTIILKIYTFISKSYKFLNKWNEALEYCYFSLEIAEKMYEENPSDVTYRKFLERRYNIANTLEAQAITEKSNLAIWEKVCESYEQVYELEAKSLSHNVSERNVFYSASSILSYGTSLIQCGKIDAGKAKYKEGFNIIFEIAENDESHQLYFETYIKLLDCIYSLCLSEKCDAASELLCDIEKCTSDIFEIKDASYIEKINKYTINFSNSFTELINEPLVSKKTEYFLDLYEIISAIYKAVLPIAFNEIKLNFMICQKSIGNIYFSKMQNFQKALENYILLFGLIDKFNLTENNDDDFNNKATLILVDVYIGMILSAVKLNNTELLEEVILNKEKFVRFICKYNNSLTDKESYLLSKIGKHISNLGYSIGDLFVT